MTEEQGRRLASEREDLIAQGVDPGDLTVPLAPITPPSITAAGGWCAPSSYLFEGFSVARGGIVYPSAEEMVFAEKRRKEWRHAHRWEIRRNRVKSWLLLRPIRQRIHDHIHRNCEDY